jgi:hypothetical protein
MPLLALGAALAIVALLVVDAHPGWLGSFIYLAPLFMLVVAPLFWLLLRAWTGALRGAEAVYAGTAPRVTDLAASDAQSQEPFPNTLTLEMAAPAPAARPTECVSVMPPPPLPDVSSAASRIVLEPGTHPYQPPTEHPMTEQPRTLTIDGTEYRIADLSDAAKQQLANLQLCDQEIQRLQHQLGIAQTARAAYANALKAELPNTTTH